MEAPRSAIGYYSGYYSAPNTHAVEDVKSSKAITAGYPAEQINSYEIGLIGAVSEDTAWSGGDCSEIDAPWMNSADCAQYASDTRYGYYQTSVIHPLTHALSNFAVRPCQFPIEVGLAGYNFSMTTIPANAEGIVYSYPSTMAYHYAKIHRGSNGEVTHFTHTDAFRHLQPGHGGTFSVFVPNEYGQLVNTARRGVGIVESLNNLEDFVNYCDSSYGAGIYFFCTFHPPSAHNK